MQTHHHAHGTHATEPQPPFSRLLDQLDATLGWMTHQREPSPHLITAFSRLKRQLRQARRFDAGLSTHGRLADLKFLQFLPLHLPFPQIALTFEDEHGLHMVLAEETSAASAAEMLSSRTLPWLETFSDGAIWVQGFSFDAGLKHWTPGQISLLVSRHWLHSKSATGDGLTLNALPVPVFEERSFPSVDEAARAYAYLAGLLSFCEALAAEDLRQDMNDRSPRKKSSIPMEATLAPRERRWRPAPVMQPAIIKLGAPRYRKTPAARPGLRHGPCEHYRRGHWRRISRARCVWVRTCLVGAQEGEYKTIPKTKKNYVIKTFS